MVNIKSLIHFVVLIGAVVCGALWPFAAHCQVGFPQRPVGNPGFSITAT